MRCSAPTRARATTVGKRGIRCSVVQESLDLEAPQPVVRIRTAHDKLPVSEARTVALGLSGARDARWRGFLTPARQLSSASTSFVSFLLSAASTLQCERVEAADLGVGVVAPALHRAVHTQSTQVVAVDLDAPGKLDEVL